MWQVMWILSLVPDWIWYILAVAGVIAVYAPIINRNIAVKASGTVALLLSIWMIGGFANEAKWQSKVEELEAKVKEAQEKSAVVNTVIETKVVTKTKVIKEKAETIIEYVDREKEIVKFDTTCPIPKEAIDVHNEAARMNQAIEELKKGTKK